jgi:hypothetical protein
MKPLTVELDDATAERLRRRAEREGVAADELAARLLAEAVSKPDPYEFFGSFESEVVGAGDTDRFLSAHDFGAA